MDYKCNRINLNQPDEVDLHHIIAGNEIKLEQIQTPRIRRTERLINRYLKGL